LACDLNEAHGFGAPYAYSLVKPGGTVRLLYHLDTFRLPAITIYGDGSEPEADAIRKKAILEAERRLRAIVPKEAEARGITTEVLVTEGRDAAEAICAAAEHFEADVICVGRHTHSGLLAKALGSVALAVVQTSKRPVLVLCPPDA
jgi:nucleotide-binding universal stress UspA family protein